MNDFRFAFRTLAKSPVVSSVAALSLALGIGANTAMFSLFDQILLKPLPVQAPEALVNFADPGPKSGSNSNNISGGQPYIFSYPMLRDLQKQTDVFSGVAGFRVFGGNVAFRGQTSTSNGVMVSGNYFSVLGLQPALGRLFNAADDSNPGGHPLAVLGYDYWNRKLGGRTDVLNEAMTINGNAMTIIGVAPQGFDGNTIGSLPDFYVPISMREPLTPGWKGVAERRNYWVYTFARLAPGVSVERAQSAVNVTYRGIIRDVEAPLQKGGSKSFMERFMAKSITLEKGAQGFGSMRRGGGQGLKLLLGITAFVLLIACANIANLLLARAANRAREISIRLSVGASRWQLVRQLMTEAMILALLGGLAGLVVSRWTLYGLFTLMPAEGARFLSESVDLRSMLFALVVSVATGMLFGIFPALNSTRPDLVSALKDQAGNVSASGAAARFRRVLVTAQIALSLLLLASAGFFVKSLANISRVDLGIRSDNLITFGLSPNLSGYTFPRASALFEKLEESLAAIPGVSSATVALVPLVAGNNWGTNVSVDGFEAGPDTDTHSMYNEIGPGYFSTVGMRLVAGREFTAADSLAGPKVAIINEAFARKFHLPVGAGAIGKRMQRGSGGKNDIEIAGVVQDAKYSQVKDPAPPLHYTPYRQDDKFGSGSVYVRTSVDPAGIIPVIRKTVSDLDPQLPLEGLKTMEQQIKENVFMDRMITILATAFAILATVLAAIGLYGVLAYSVARRTREFGIRLALGASAVAVRNMVLKEVAIMVAVGAAIAVPSILGLARYFESLLYGLKGNDATVIAGAVILLGLISLLSGYLPALRATRIDPMQALRYE